VGPDCKSFSIHTELVAHHSAPLGVMMKGPWREAQDGFAELKDVDEATFVRFCEYAYMGDYTPTQPEGMLDSSVITQQSTSFQDHIYNATADLNLDSREDEWGFNSKKRDKKKRATSKASCARCGYTLCICIVSSGKQALLNSFQELYYPLPI